MDEGQEFKLVFRGAEDAEAILVFSEGDQEFDLDFGEVIIAEVTGVSSVNGKTGDVVLGAHDVGAYTKAESDERIKSGSGAPTVNTSGVLGTIYNDTDTGIKYVCISISTEEGHTTYTWQKKQIPEQGVIEKGNTGYVSGGQVWAYNEENIIFRRF